MMHIDKLQHYCVLAVSGKKLDNQIDQIVDQIKLPAINLVTSIVPNGQLFVQRSSKQ